MTDLGFIVKMVIYKCRELGNPVTETLAAYVAQTTLNKRRDLIHANIRYRYRQVLFGKSGFGGGSKKTR